ncbi:membrane protein containing Adenylyl cyclase class-3/4/guanylyl cyclase [Candidatus Magnetomorum sp. HK-1]|nr:membrane protein containing Adenylyl cyclase class-3/4/guanylyl cyclase [Candidatus Magnetomorum sp. HK-1]
MQRKRRKRYDIWLIVVLFFISIPAEYFEIFSLIEEQFISIRHSLRHHFGHLPDLWFEKDQIVLVTIDETFFDEYKGFPLKRSDLAKMVNNINKLKPSVICIDLLLKYSSAYGDDPELAHALSKANTILASQLMFEKNQKFSKISYPAPLFHEQSKTGYVNMISTSRLVSSLSRLRIYKETVSLEGGWPIAVQALSSYLGITPKLEKNTLIMGKQTITLNQFNELLIDFVPLPDNCLFLNEMAGITALEFLDFSDMDEEELNELSFWIKDKIVILADTSEESHDKFNSPAGLMYGAEIIANTIHTLIKGGQLHQASLAFETVSCFLFLFGIVVLVYIVQDPKIRALMLSLWFMIYIFICAISYIYYGLVISMSYTIIAGFLGIVTIFLRSYIIERLLKYEALEYQAILAKSYSRFVPHEYLGFLSKDNIVDVELGDHISQEMAVMFSDIRSFTTLSEGMTPQENFDFVNAYLKRVSPFVREQKGFIVKYLGDGMMAMFPNCPNDAIQAGLKKLEHVSKYNEDRKKAGRKPIKIGVGIHIGHMMVGIVGEKARMQGDAFSDDVNLTSRLEGLTKMYGVSMIISENMYQQLRPSHDYRIRFLDHVKVKGRNRPIKIYEIYDADPPEIRDLKDKIYHQYRQGQEFFFQQDFVKAISFFKDILNEFPEDKPSKIYLERATTYCNQGVCIDWDIADIQQK